MPSVRRVEFSTFDGTILRGKLYLPDKEHAPAIVMAVGVSTTSQSWALEWRYLLRIQLTFLKDHFGDMPDRLRVEGYAVLMFDEKNGVRAMACQGNIRTSTTSPMMFPMP